MGGWSGYNWLKDINLNRKSCFFYEKKGLSSKISLKPIQWLNGSTWQWDIDYNWMETLKGKSSNWMVDFPYLIAQGEMDDTIWYYSPVLPSMLDSITMHNPLPSSTKGGFELNTQNSAHMYFSDIKSGWCHLCNRKRKHGTQIKAVTSEGNYELQKTLRHARKLSCWKTNMRIWLTKAGMQG